MEEEMNVAYENVKKINEKEKAVEKKMIFARVTKVEQCEEICTLQKYRVELVTSERMSPVDLANAVINGLSDKFSGVFDLDSAILPIPEPVPSP